MGHSKREHGGEGSGAFTERGAERARARGGPATELKITKTYLHLPRETENCSIQLDLGLMLVFKPNLTLTFSGGQVLS